MPTAWTVLPGWLIRPEPGQMTMVISKAMHEQLV
jgi:hypothetical protein